MGNFSAICFSVNNVTIVLEVAYSGLWASSCYVVFVLAVGKDSNVLLYFIQ